MAEDHYQARDLAIDVREGVVFSEVKATVAVTAAEAGLLLKRLRRLPDERGDPFPYRDRIGVHRPVAAVRYLREFHVARGQARREQGTGG